jgi:HTH-like domain
LIDYTDHLEVDMERIVRRHYTGDFKALAVSLAESAVLAAAGRKLGISSKTIANWVRTAGEGGALSSAKRRPVSDLEAEVSRLRAELKELHRGSRQRYRRRRLVHALRARGRRVNVKRVRRLMLEERLRGRRKGRFVSRTTDIAHHRPVAENVLERRFGVASGVAAWASDIT